MQSQEKGKKAQGKKMGQGCPRRNKWDTGARK